VSNTAHSRPSFRFRGRSFMAFVLTPELPLPDWMAGLDNQLQRAEGFFLGRPVVLDLSRVAMGKPELENLISDLNARNIRIIGIEAADSSCLGPGLPPLLKGGRPVDGIIEPSDVPTAETPPAKGSAGQQSSFLLLDSPVRSGQSVVFPGGDVTVVGSVASGAEVIAGGSIHIYGSLRGRAMAGSTGNPRARIFCRKIEAELLAIDGLYKTADDIDASLRNRPVQAWLDGDVLMMAPFD
jgi:septum site-determining protein MinC